MPPRTHGESATRLYWMWSGMKKRCYNVNNKDYNSYGGRGVTVCLEWKSDYVAFREWALSHGYAEGLQLDRIDNEKGYSPDNCRWVTSKQNNSNRRTTKKVRIGNQEKPLSEWADIFDLPRETVYQRSKKGMDLNTLFAPGGKEIVKP